jgi:hypothetical protein
MNERIKELIPRPWTFPYPDREMYSREQMEHFAELLVRECIGIVKQRWINPDEDVIAEEIKQHFGVEE